MKKVFYIGLLFLPMIFSCSSDDSPAPSIEIPDDGPGFEVTTAIVDPVFEQALVDLDLDDKVDGTVVTSKILGIRDLILDDLGITDLRGIQDFNDLENLSVNGNALVRLDLSDNTKLKFIYADNNALTFINVQDLAILEKISAPGNVLVSMDTSTNPALQLLVLNDNDVEISDVSMNPALTTFAIEENPVSCIRVSAAQLADIPQNWTKDAGDTYSEDCN